MKFKGRLILHTACKGIPPSVPCPSGYLHVSAVFLYIVNFTASPPTYIYASAFKNINKGQNELYVNLSFIYIYTVTVTVYSHSMESTQMYSQ